MSPASSSWIYERTGGLGWNRRDHKRLEALRGLPIFPCRRLLDIGCNEGFFSFSFSDLAEQVLAVDGNERLIRENQLLAQQHALTNVTFECGVVTREFLERIQEPLDVTLVLSVLHHIIADSDVYPFQEARGLQSAIGILEPLVARSRLVVVELGMPDEPPEEWAPALERVMGGADQMVESAWKLLAEPAGATGMEVVPAPSCAGWTGRVRRAVLERGINKRIRLSLPYRAVRRGLRLDTRERRPLLLIQGRGGAASSAS